MRASSEELINTISSTWQALESAVSNPDNPLRYLTLCTVDQHQKPQARILVLRKVTPANHQLSFHTNIRSAKWEELDNSNSLTIVGYSPEQRIQLRFSGHAILHGPGSPENLAEWERLSTRSRQGYFGPAPGEPLSETNTASDPAAFDKNDHDVSPDFGVIAFHANSLDWFEHKNDPLRRARHTFGNSELADRSFWISP